jgi:hypothetical protein
MSPPRWAGLAPPGDVRQSPEPSARLRGRAQVLPPQDRKLADGGKHYAPMPEKDANVLKVLIGQVAERLGSNAVFGKTLGVLGHAELYERVRYLFRRLRAHDPNSSSKALASFRSSVSKPSVNQP